jgi:hypothetical protein
MSYIRPFGALLCATVFTMCSSSDTTRVRSFNDADVQESPFIFSGTVVNAGGSNVDIVPAGSDTAVVRVDEVMSSTGTLADFGGAEITVKLAPGDVVRDGSRSTFLTTPLAYGKSMAVKVNRRVGSNDAARVRTEIGAATQRNADNTLAARLTTAELVVLGKVDAVRLPEPPARLTEHDPQFAETIVAVESVEKGDAPAPTVVVLQARSTDVMWYRAPKLQVGQRALFLLRRAPALTGARTNTFAVVEAIDVQPPEQLERVRTLLRRNR